MSIMFKVCKRTIERVNYPEDMMLRINVFYNDNLITADEHDKLINMLL